MESQYGRMDRGVGALLLGCAALSALAWVDWVIEGGSPFGIPYPVVVMVALALNVAATMRFPRAKRRIVVAVQRHLLNPVVGAVVRLGIPLGWSLLETTGRTTGRRRVVPVGNGHEGDRFWIVAEHGLSAGYVRNLRADPHVRVRVRRGLRMVWRPGVAHVLVDDDPARRQRLLVGWRHPLRALNAVMVTVLAVQPVTIRIDLDTAPASHVRRRTGPRRAATATPTRRPDPASITTVPSRRADSSSAASTNDTPTCGV